MNRRGHDWSRRGFLKLGSSLMVAVATSGCGFGGPGLDDVAKTMVGTLHHVERARLLGELYVQDTFGTEGKAAEDWTRELLEILRLDPASITEDMLASLPERLRYQVRQDFEAEDIVVLAGFLFSRTEILLCTLAAALEAEA